MIRRLVAAVSAAIVAGTTATLSLAAAADAWLHDSGTVLVALAAVFIAQTLFVLARRTTRTERPE